MRVSGAAPEFLECRRDGSIHLNNAALVVLRVPHNDLMSSEVDVVPGEVQELAASHAGIQRRDDNRTQVGGASLKQGRNLLWHASTL